MSANLTFLGFGLGLRTEHYNTILETKPDIDWFEALSENYMIPGGKPLNYLDKNSCRLSSSVAWRVVIYWVHR